MSKLCNNTKQQQQKQTASTSNEMKNATLKAHTLQITCGWMFAVGHCVYVMFMKLHYFLCNKNQRTLAAHPCVFVASKCRHSNFKHYLCLYFDFVCDAHVLHTHRLSICSLTRRMIEKWKYKIHVDRHMSNRSDYVTLHKNFVCYMYTYILVWPKILSGIYTS